MLEDRLVFLRESNSSKKGVDDKALLIGFNQAIVGQAVNSDDAGEIPRADR